MSFFKNLVDNILDVLIVVDLSGSIFYINSRIHDLLGYTPEEFIGLNIFHFVHPEDYQKFSKEIKRSRRSHTSLSIEYRLKHKAGYYIPVNGRANFYKINKKILVAAVISDLTERKEHEADLEKLHFLEKKSLLITENAKDLITIINDNLKIDYVNGKAHYDTLGYTKEELLNMSIFKLIPLEDQKKVFIDFVQGAKTGQGTTITRLIHKSGHHIWVETNGTIFKDVDGKEKSLVFSRDITEKRDAEQRIKISEKKYREAFNLAEMYKELFAHDTNSILQNMLSALELTRDKLSSKGNLKEFENILNIMEEEVKRGASLVSNIRKLSQIEEKAMSLKSMNIIPVLKNSVNTIKKVQLERPLDITIENPYSTLYINANEILSDVFENLLSNAIRYNDNPFVKIYIRVSKEKINKVNFIKIEFLDNGIGIQSDHKSSIFLRVRNKSKSLRGMGLGLSVVKKIVDLFNGQIIVEDRVEGDYTQGSNFILYFPEELNKE